MIESPFFQQRMTWKLDNKRSWGSIRVLVKLCVQRKAHSVSNGIGWLLSGVGMKIIMTGGVVGLKIHNCIEVGCYKEIDNI